MFPAASWAEHWTVLVPSANVLPDAGAQVTAGAFGAVSVAVTAKLTIAPAALVASATRGDVGRWSTGGVVSQPTTVAVTGSVTFRVMALPFEALTPEARYVTEPE